LFWTFLGFFLLIGILSLLAMAGVVKTDPQFRRWAVTGFIAAVTGAVIGLFNITFNKQAALFVTLIPPQEEILDLVVGEYKYDEPSSSGVKTHSGRVEMALGEGGWQAKLPQEVLDKPVELSFKDRNNNWWGIRPFYPNHNRQVLVKTQAPTPPPVGHLFEGTPAGNAYANSIESRTDPRKPGPSPLLIAKIERPLKFDNYARSMGAIQNRTFYKWRVFLDEPQSVLDTIADVQYLLHPTFPEPTQVRSDPTNKFALETSGWGEFTIIITVRYKDGSEEKISYHLDLSKKWPAG
jgi:hypothetical protein